MLIFFIAFFISLIEFLRSRISICFFLMISLFVKLLILFVYYYPDFIELPFWFFLYLVDFPQNSTFVYWVTHTILCLLVQLVEDYWGFFLMSCFLVSSYSLEFCVAVFCTWGNSHVFQSLVIAFGWEVFFVGSTYIWGFLWPWIHLHGYTYSMLLAPSLWQNY